MRDMNDDIEALFEEARDASLDAHERARMREELKLFMTEHPARMPFILRMSTSFSSILDAAPLSYVRLHPVALALVLVLGLGVGTSYAAERALPGDVLYPVKLNVTESLQGALAVSDEAKAQWNAKRASRRLAEAEVLAQNGRLTAEVQSAIEMQFDKSNDEFDANVRALASATGSASVVAAATADLEMSLKSHDETLAKVASDAPQSKSALDSIRGRVRNRVDRVARVRIVANHFVDVAHGSKPKDEVHAKREDGVSAPVLQTARVETASMNASEEAATTTVSESEHIEASIPPAEFEAAVEAAQSDERDTPDRSDKRGRSTMEEETNGH